MAKIPENIPLFVHELLNKIATTENFVDYQIEFKAGCKHGDGFLSDLLSVTISDQQRLKASLCLICKLAPSNALRRREFESISLFKREALIYLKILPILRKFEFEKGLSETDSFLSTPKCYAAIADDTLNQYVIIMEDVRLKGYSMWPKNEVIPVDYAYRLMEQLGKLHAISFALKDQRPSVYEDFRRIRDVACTFFKTNTLVQAIDMAYIRALSVLEDPKHIEIVKDIQVNSQKYFEECLMPDLNENFAVICHGDCWINNLLFRDSEIEEALDVCMVDWQMSRFASPVLDLLYILSTSTDKQFRQKYYQNLVKHYHQSISESIKRLGSDPDKLFPIECLESQLRKFGKYAFLQGLNIIQMVLADSEDIPDLDNMSKNNECKDFIRVQKTTTHSEYTSRIRDLLTDLIEYGYYNWKEAEAEPSCNN